MRLASCRSEELLKYIEGAVKSVRSLHVVWCGGEPLLAMEIVSGLSRRIIAIAEAGRVEYSADMVTNGYLISEDPGVVRRLRDSRIESFQEGIKPNAMHARYCRFVWRTDVATGQCT